MCSTFYSLCEKFELLNSIRRFYLYVLRIDLWMQLALFILFFVIWYREKKRNVHWKAVCIAFLWTYIVMLLMSLVFSRKTQENYMINMSVFWTIRAILNGKTQYIREILLNCFMLFPVGFLYPLVKKAGFVECISIGCSFSVTIEMLQLLMKAGVCEMDDILYNVTGCIGGYLAYRLGYQIYKAGTTGLQRHRKRY